MAVQKAHGLWCDNKALKVKVANFAKGKEEHQRLSKASVGWRELGNISKVPTEWRAIGNTSRAPSMVQRGKSYAQAVSGRGLEINTTMTINASKEGIGWLYNSVIVRLKPSSGGSCFLLLLFQVSFGVAFRCLKLHDLLEDWELLYMDGNYASIRSSRLSNVVESGQCFQFCFWSVLVLYGVSVLVSHQLWGVSK
ncbi:hypothetical protein ACSBR2_015606 [Camellia fascicularis]